ncbi:GNAT family N-acetyltransferase [Streptomyces sp. NBC_00086]|uniref:GNAT family N-acetyltransferase n=1 Tax=unclassified Streptomyces TaxID=2593676 RepID=UPI00338F9E50
MLRIESHISTARLILRPFRPEGTEYVYDYQRRPDVARFMRWEPRGRRTSGGGGADGSGGRTGLGRGLSQPGGRRAGHGNCHRAGRTGPAQHATPPGEIGYLFHPAHQGKGYATETAVAVLSLPSTPWGCRAVYWARISVRSAPVAFLCRCSLPRTSDIHAASARPHGRYRPVRSYAHAVFVGR